MSEAQARHKLLMMQPQTLGRFGEAVFKNLLSFSGLSFIALCDIESGGAPMVRGKDTIVLPDFDLTDGEASIYLEVKVKTTSIIYRIARQERHGIDRRNYAAYQRAGVVYRKNCGIGLIELQRDTGKGTAWSGALLVETFRNLGEPISGESNQRHMVYWQRKKFVDLDSLTAIELFEAANGRPTKRYTHELRRVFFPMKQTAMF